MTEPLFLRTLRGERTPVPPIWFMRQAGRYLPEYRAYKERYSFWEMARTPEIAADVTLQPIRRLGVDAAILFQDIMTPLPALGIDIEFAPGPVIREPIRSQAQVDALRRPEPAEIAPFVSDAIGLIRAESPVPLIGFGGAPLTLATYLVEGSGSKEYNHFRAFLRREPAAAHALLARLRDVSIDYLTEQVRAGAQAIQLFDSWAGLHDPATYAEFGFPYARDVLDAVGRLSVPRLYIGVHTLHLFDVMRQLPVEAFSVDWRQPLDVARERLAKPCIQGNLDPVALLGPRDRLAKDVAEIVRAGSGGAHIFNLGHGMLPQTDPDAVQFVVDHVREIASR